MQSILNVIESLPQRRRFNEEQIWNNMTSKAAYCNFFDVNGVWD
jgi:hypothetical protein